MCFMHPFQKMQLRNLGWTSISFDVLPGVNRSTFVLFTTSFRIILSIFYLFKYFLFDRFKLLFCVFLTNYFDTVEKYFIVEIDEYCIAKVFLIDNTVGAYFHAII